MKIVQILPELNEGGVERGVVELGRELTNRDFDSFVISNGGKLVSLLESEGSRHIKFDVCSKNPLSVPARIYKLRKLLKELKPDILHVRSRVPAWLIHFANKNLEIPVVSTVHGFNSVNFYSKIMTQANSIICVSESIKEYIQKHYNIADKKITIIPRGIDLETFNPKNLDNDFIENFKKKFKLNGKFIVSTVGRITQLKDLETFIQAVFLLQKKFPNTKGLIAGGVRSDKKEYFSSLKKLAQSLHVEVVFAGSQSKVAEIYSLSDVVISSSKKPESFGRSVAEALALNTPVVATNHGGVLDIIQDTENGFFFEVGDFESLAYNIINARKLKFDGFGYIRDNFSLEQMVKKTVGVYKNLEK